MICALYLLSVGGAESEGAEDIHLILEYKIGESWGIYRAPRANRYVFWNVCHGVKTDTVVCISKIFFFWSLAYRMFIINISINQK